MMRIITDTDVMGDLTINGNLTVNGNITARDVIIAASGDVIAFGGQIPNLGKCTDGITIYKNQIYVNGNTESNPHKIGLALLRHVDEMRDKFSIKTTMEDICDE